MERDGGETGAFNDSGTGRQESEGSGRWQMAATVMADDRRAGPWMRAYGRGRARERGVGWIEQSINNRRPR